MGRAGRVLTGPLRRGERAEDHLVSSTLVHTNRLWGRGGKPMAICLCCSGGPLLVTRVHTRPPHTSLKTTLRPRLPQLPRPVSPRQHRSATYTFAVLHRMRASPPNPPVFTQARPRQRGPRSACIHTRGQTCPSLPRLPQRPLPNPVQAPSASAQPPSSPLHIVDPPLVHRWLWLAPRLPPPPRPHPKTSSCQRDDGGEDLKKGTQQLEVYALEIQMATEQVQG